MSVQDNFLQTQTDDISIKEIILKIKKWYASMVSHWKVIAFVSIFFSAVAVIYAFFQKPIYKATLTFALEDEKSMGSGLSGALGLASSFGFDLGSSGGGAFSSANLIELMKSRKLVEKTLLKSVIVNGKSQSLADYYLDATDARKKWEGKPRLTNLSFSIDGQRKDFSLIQDSILYDIYKGLLKKELTILQKDKKVSIISIDVSSTDELFAKTFCEKLANETSSYYIEIKSKKAKMNVDILQKQTDSIRAELNGAISGVAAATDNVFNLNTAMNYKRTPSIKRQVDVQANTAILTQLVGNLELAKVALRKDTPLIQIIDTPILPLDKERVSKLKALILGGMLGCFTTIIFLSFQKWYKNAGL